MRLARLEEYYSSPEYRAKIISRLEVLQLVERDPLLLTQLVVDRWACNPIEFIEQFGWIINPKFHNEIKPFFLFDYQKDIIKKVWEAEVSGAETELLVDKPREMGLTWVFVWYYIWRFLFTKNWSGAVLSRSEAEVDDGTTDPSKCYDEQTEILTDKGWKFFKDLDRTEKVLTRNLENNTIEYQQPIQYVNEEYKGDMYKYSARHIDFLVTPNHNFFVNSRKDKKLRFKTAEELANSYYETYTTPLGGDFTGVDNKDISDEDCAFLGLYLSEGWVGNKSNIYFSKTKGIKGGISGWKGDVRKDFENLLTKMKLDFYDYSDTIHGDRGVYILNRERKEYLEKIGKCGEKYIPVEYKNLPPRKLQIIIDWMLKGDGSLHKGMYSYDTSSKRLADDFQEIVAKTGKCAVIKKRKIKVGDIVNYLKDGTPVICRKEQYQVAILGKKTQSYGLKNNRINKTKYDGRIYCLEVPNHTLMVRRNGKMYWSGNSIFGKLRWSMQHLPAYLIPEGFVFKGKKGTTTDMSLRLSNPQMMSSIIGSTANQNAFRGSRFSFAWVDECFFIEHFLAVNRSIKYIANTRVYVSTSKVGRMYQKYVDNREEAGQHIQLTWKDNPFKDQQWYDEKVKESEFDPEAIKEIDVSYAINSTMQYYPELLRSKIASVAYQREKPIYVSLDYGRSDHTVLIWWQFDGANFNILECIAKNKVDFEWFVPILNREVAYDETRYVFMKELMNRIRSWNKPKAYFGEAAHKQVHYPSNTSIQKELAKSGIRLMTNDYAVQYEVRRKGASMILPKCVFNQDSDGVMELYDALLNSRYAGTTKGTSKESLMKPAHDDVVGDYRSAFENGAVCIGNVIRGQRTEVHSSLKEDNFAGNLIKYLRM